jgi:hypothetical protein
MGVSGIYRGSLASNFTPKDEITPAKMWTVWRKGNRWRHMTAFFPALYFFVAATNS